MGIHVVLVSPGSIRTSAEGKLDRAGIPRRRSRSDGRDSVSRPDHPHSETPLPGGPQVETSSYALTKLPPGVADNLRMRLLHVYRPFGAART